MPEDIYDAYGLLHAAHQSLKQGLVDTIGVLQALAEGELSAEDIEFSRGGFTLKQKEAIDG